MARGAQVQHIRKAGTFTSGQLGAGEIGINTTDDRPEFSTDGSDVVIVPVAADITAAKDRANHTGTQFASSVSNFNAAALSAAPAETANTLANVISGTASKTTPVDNDAFLIVDTEASNVGKRLTWANVKATLKTYFDTLTTTFTNKRITKRTGTVTSSATPTINTDNVDFYSITALAAAITSMTTNLSGTPTEGQTLWIAITDNGTARAITWGASFEGTLPTTTVISTRLDIGLVWNTVTSKWRGIAVNSTNLLNGLTVTATTGTITVPNGTTQTFPPATSELGYLNIPQNSQSAAYTLVLADAGKHILHPAADTTARTFTIPANSSVAFAIGTAITFINQNAGGVITIAITTDTMRLSSAGTTGSRTLAANGVATAIKITSTEWIISGTGLT